jgi:hypothetical protein
MTSLCALSLSTVALKFILVSTSSHYRFSLSPTKNILGGTFLVCAGIALFSFALRSRNWGLISFWVFAICDMTLYSGSYLQGLPKGGITYYEAETVPVAPPGPVFAAKWKDNVLTLAGYHLADGYAGLEPRALVPMSDANYLKVLGVTAVQDVHGDWFLPPAPLEPVRLALPFYSDHPVEAMNHIDLTRMAVVTQDVTVDTAASGLVRITDQHPGFLHIAAQTTGRALCVVAQRFHPGWTARTSERELQLMAVDGDLTGFVLPGGKQDVILEFLPKDFILGRNITLAALLFVMLFFALNRLTVFSRASQMREGLHVGAKWQ